MFFQSAFHGRPKIQKEMKSVSNLLRRWRAALRSLRVDAPAISADHANSRLLLQPCPEALSRAIRQQILHGTALQIDQNRAVGLPFAPGPVINIENLQRVILGRRRRGFHTPQHGVIAGASGQAGQKSGAR